METQPKIARGNLQEFVKLLSELRGVIEVRVQSKEDEAWIGLRTGKNRPATVLLQQVSRAAVGFGLDSRSVHFGILAD